MKYISILSLFLFTFLSAQVPDKAEDISPLLVGEKVPNTKLINLEGNEVKFKSIYTDKKTILVVFRGSWCPYCTAQLSGLGVILEDLQALDYQLVAVSPENFTKSKDLIEEVGIEYTLLADESTEFIQELGIAFYRNEKKGILPVPAVYILDTNGDILFENINPSYGKRLDEEVLLAVAKALKDK